MNKIAIEIKNVTKIFGTSADAALDLLHEGATKADIQSETDSVVGINDVSLTVEAGQIYVVMGLSGSGKSTLIRHVNRLIDPTAGEIFVNGVDVLKMDMQELREFRQTKVAMVFQKFGLLPHRSVIENVAYGLEIRGVDKEERLAKAQEWITTVGLAGYEESQPHQLSGGQQQRIGLARALAMDVDILLMDEAFSALDPLIRSEMQDELLVLQKKLNKTILFITHDFDEALKIGDRIAVLKDGELIQEGRPQEIVLNPANEHVEAFVQGVNKARAIHVRMIMDTTEVAEQYEANVPAHATCEDVLPLFAEHQWVGVTDEQGEQIGRLTLRNVIRTLARHQSESTFAGN